MADRGKKVSSYSVEQLRVKKEMEAHKRHLEEIRKGKAHVDTKAPIGTNIKMGHNNPKNKIREAEKQHEIDQANVILMQRLKKIEQVGTDPTRAAHVSPVTALAVDRKGGPLPTHTPV